MPLEWSVPLPLDANFSTLFYEFSTKDGDINFAVNFIDHRGNARSILAMQRYPSDVQTICGSYEFDTPGIVVLVWDNSHAWFGTKLLSYSVHIQKVQMIIS